LVGGFANILFADGHVARVNDTGGLNNAPDGWLGPYKNDVGAFEINEGAFKEIRADMLWSRMKPKGLPGGGSIE